MKKLGILMISAVAMLISLCSCEEVAWEGGGIGYYLDFEVYDSNGNYFLENPNYQEIADKIQLRIEHEGKEYYLNEKINNRALPFLGFYVEGGFVNNTNQMIFGIVYPEENNNYYSLKYIDKDGNTITHDIRVKVYDRKRGTKNNPPSAKYKFYIDDNIDKDGIFNITLK